MEGLPSLQLYINSLTHAELADFNDMLETAETKVTCLGSRIVTIENYQGPVYLDDITSSLLHTAQNCSLGESETGREIVGKLRNLYHRVDGQMENSCWFTKIVILIREFFSPSFRNQIVNDRPLAEFFNRSVLAQPAEIDSLLMPGIDEDVTLFTVTGNTTLQEIEGNVREAITPFVTPAESLEAVTTYLSHKIINTRAQAGEDIYFYKSSEFYCGDAFTIAFRTEVRDRITLFEEDPTIATHQNNFSLRRNYIQDTTDFPPEMRNDISTLQFALNQERLAQGLFFYHGDPKLSFEEKLALGIA